MRAPQSPTAAKVLDDHLRMAQEATIDADFAANYGEDVVLLTSFGIYHGEAGLRELTERLLTEVADPTFSYGMKLVHADVAFLEWRATSARAVIEDGADSYVIRDGRIIAQTIHYMVEPA